MSNEPVLLFAISSIDHRLKGVLQYNLCIAVCFHFRIIIDKQSTAEYVTSKRQVNALTHSWQWIENNKPYRKTLWFLWAQSFWVRYRYIYLLGHRICWKMLLRLKLSLEFVTDSYSACGFVLEGRSRSSELVMPSLWKKTRGKLRRFIQSYNPQLIFSKTTNKRPNNRWNITHCCPGK